MNILLEITLKDVLYVPDFRHNLLFVSRLFDENHLRIKFNRKGCIMQNLTTNQIVASGSVQDGVYKLEKSKGTLKEKQENKIACNLERPRVLINQNVIDDLSIWHVRLGHLSLRKLKNWSYGSIIEEENVLVILVCKQNFIAYLLN